MCGASSEQKQVFGEENTLFKNMQDQMAQIFGKSSNVFNDLTSALSPIAGAGAAQRGFSPAESAALKSEAITDTGTAYKNARQAVGERQAAQGGGTLELPGGSKTAADISLANSAAAQTSSELNQIETADWNTGRQNFWQSISPLEAAPNVFNSATGAGEAAVGAGSAASTTANEISQANNSWVNSVTGMLGGIAGNMIAPGVGGGLITNMMKPGGGGGGYTSNPGSQRDS